MRDKFPGYFTPSEEEFAHMWREGIFVLDTNVLLNLYRYTPSTSEEYLQLLESVQDRIWLPNQVAKEFLEERRGVIAKQKSAYDDIEKAARDAQNKFQSTLNGWSRHPYIDVKPFAQIANQAFDVINKTLQSLRQRHPDAPSDDSILDRVSVMFAGKVGGPYSEEDTEKILKAGTKRYAKEIPPGYKDGRKGKGDERFGDLILWMQTLDMAKNDKKPIIFVTDDRKEDWWLLFEGAAIGPRPELIEEMRAISGVLLYMYSAEKFLEYAGTYLGHKVDRDAVEEANLLAQSEAVDRFQEMLDFASSLKAPPEASFDTVLSRVYGMCMWSMQEGNGVLDIARMSSTIAVTREAIIYALLCLEASGDFEVVRSGGNDWFVTIGNGQRNRVQERGFLIKLMNELGEIQAAYNTTLQAEYAELEEAKYEQLLTDSDESNL